MPADLISLNYSRKPSGEIHDPITFKPFSEHSHIVAIATTGNVFLAESVKGGRDLLNDVRFKKCVLFLADGRTNSIDHIIREDVITLQNPHGLAPASVSSKATAEKKAVTEKEPPKAGPVAAVKKDTPCTFPCCRKLHVFTTCREYIALFIWLTWRFPDVNFGRSSDSRNEAGLGRGELAAAVCVHKFITPRYRRR